jgi:hypothetical protein
MLFLLHHRYPRLGAVLSVLSSLAFVAWGLAEHSTFMVVSSALFLVLPLAQGAARRRGVTR